MTDRAYYLSDIFDYESVIYEDKLYISYLNCTLKIDINIDTTIDRAGTKFDKIRYEIGMKYINFIKYYNNINYGNNYDLLIKGYYVNIDNRHYDCLTYGLNCFFITCFGGKPTKGISNKVLKIELNNKKCEIIFKNVRFEGEQINNVKLDPYNGILDINGRIYQYKIKIVYNAIIY